MYTIKHKFISGKADGTDTTLVKPTNWNEEHELIMDEGTIIGRPPGSGTGPGQSIPISSLLPAGVMTMWGGITAPTGWLLCQGQSLLRADYPLLFAVIGGYYGAVDASHFSLPDMRGRVAAGVDGIGRLTGNTINNPAVPGGAGGQEMEQAYADVNISAGGRSYGQTGGEAITSHVWGGTDSGNQTQFGGIVGSGDVAHNYHQHNIDIWGNAYGVQSCWADGTYYGSGGGYTRAVSNVQPTLMVNYIIKAA